MTYDKNKQRDVRITLLDHPFILNGNDEHLNELFKERDELYDELERVRPLDGNTQADFDAVNNGNANMQMEIIELRTRLAKLIKDVRRASKGKVCVSSIKL